MNYLMMQILAHLVVAVLLGLVLGYLLWGWGLKGKLDAARAAGRRSITAKAARKALSGLAGDPGSAAEVARLTAELEDETRARVAAEGRAMRLTGEARRATDARDAVQSELDALRGAGAAVTPEEKDDLK